MPNDRNTNLDVGAPSLGPVAMDAGNTGQLQRKIGWEGAFWVASGVPALVLFSIGAIAATIGKPSWMVWMVSVMIGFLQAFTYAEISGLFPHKSGGASVYGAVAWLRYSKFIAPISVWCNWVAWSPVLAIGSGLAAGYILTALFPATAAINTWQLTLLELGFIKSGLALRINSTFLLGTAILLVVYAVQDRGVAKMAQMQKILGISALLPLMVVALVPILTGDMPSQNFLPLAPLAHDAAGNPVQGVWNMAGWTLMAGALFIAAWSTYGFETAVCYTREFKDPKNDTFKAILYSGLLCLVVFSMVPLAFQGALGLDGLLKDDIYSGMGVAAAMASMVGGGAVVGNILITMLVLAVVLSIMTSMGGTSRTLYQGSRDGWLPKYLGHANEHGAPTRAMRTTMGFNLLLLMMSDYVFVLAVSNVNYILYNFLNLQAGWIHRKDRPDAERPFRCPTWLLGLGAALGFLNLAFMGLGADIWGTGTLISGLAVAAFIIPVFYFRHYVQDKGAFPEEMQQDMRSESGGKIEKRAGVLPYLALAAGVAVIWLSNSLAVLP